MADTVQHEVLWCAIRGVTGSWHADYCGVADLAPAHAFIEEYGGADIAAFPRAVSVGIVLSGAVVDMLPKRAEPPVALAYRTHAYQVINARLDLIASEIGSVIQQGGYAAIPVPASVRSDSERICAPFSHKLAAHLAGFGWIGKSCLLVTPDHGPRVRWCTVLTDAPLNPTGTPPVQQCGECDACVNACPVHAFTGRAFSSGEGREARFDAHACEEYHAEMEQACGVPVCGMCLYICPHGRKGR
jgi:epoxyqueuosine reductase